MQRRLLKTMAFSALILSARDITKSIVKLRHQERAEDFRIPWPLTFSARGGRENFLSAQGAPTILSLLLGRFGIYLGR